MSGKNVVPTHTSRCSSRPREPRCIREPVGLEGSVRGSEARQVAQPTLTISNPPSAAARRVLHQMQQRQSI